MEPLPYSHLAKGTFLVATPEIETGIFFRGVVLLCDHSASGSFGVVINKPLEVELPEEILSLENIANTDVELRAGGPIQTNQMMLLHTSSEDPEQTTEICEGVHLGGDLDFLQHLVDNPEGGPVRLCFGYTAWTPGLLEREFLDGHWYLCPASKRHLFETPPAELWRTLLREMGGKYAVLSMIPDDLSLN
ncbi:MAG: YqgE/AlgH family protein [Parachlamydiales bacterium]